MLASTTGVPLVDQALLSWVSYISPDVFTQVRMLCVCVCVCTGCGGDG